MASPGLRRRCAVPLPGRARPPSSASSCAAASGPRPRPQPRAPTPWAASAPAHGPLPSRASTGARKPRPPGFHRAPPLPGSAAAAAAPWGRVASCKYPALRKQAPALQSHPAGARPEPRRPRAGADCKTRTEPSHQLRLGLCSRRGGISPRARARTGTLFPSPCSSFSLPTLSPPETLSRPLRELPLSVALPSRF